MSGYKRLRRHGALHSQVRKPNTTNVSGDLALYILKSESRTQQTSPETWRSTFSSQKAEHNKRLQKTFYFDVWLQTSPETWRSTFSGSKIEISKIGGDQSPLQISKWAPEFCIPSNNRLRILNSVEIHPGNLFLMAKFLSGDLPKDLRLSISPKAEHNKRFRKTFYLDVRLHTSPESLPDFPLTIARSQFHTRIFSSPAFSLAGLRIFPGRSPKFSSKSSPETSIFSGDLISPETFIHSGDLITPETTNLSGDHITLFLSLLTDDGNGNSN
ncbi:hypothetical protein Nepgr_010625 [Nepenthes gracilis]|uniref:Uncharacterized protein n=1 Tax=Nepenthes gracilis TaxID=150966 RepID=A0AAD3SDL5_NEPGR|nr:hypothetical protein Nepgr_010625 [Nepenthes gracilis]